MTSNPNKNNKMSHNLIVVCLSFKLNNIFITINEFIKFFEVFKFHHLIKSYSCGMSNLKNKNKTSIKSYNIIAQRLTFFLIENNITKINLIFKSSKKIKYVFINILLNTLNASKFIKILNIYFKLSTPSNGCKLQKNKFL